MINQHYSVDSIVSSLLDLIEEKAVTGPRTYGFEYEFIPVRVLQPEDMDAIYGHLRSEQFRGTDGLFSSCVGMGISFEPGGQIEFCSIPLTADDETGLSCQLERIAAVLDGIRSDVGIEYSGKGFMPDRGTAPMILNAQRYKTMHERFGHSGTRGREMMKGTASIQLHARIRNASELVPIYNAMLNMMDTDPFRMSREREDIWSNTDRTRCGLPGERNSAYSSVEELLTELAEFTMEAVDFATGEPWRTFENMSFDDFLAHMTTIFTDIRLNTKGITWELRTPESVPMDQFPGMYRAFVETLEQVPAS